MTPSFDLQIVGWEAPFRADALEAATHASLRIGAGDSILTQVHDSASRSVRDVVRVSLYPLAEWFATNWWRLRWEGGGRDTSWRLAHRLGAAGKGYAWPDIEFSSTGDTVAVTARRLPPAPCEPVEYLTDAHVIVPAGAFEASIEAFVETVLARLRTTGHRATPLHDLWDAVVKERRDDECAFRSRVEALLGHDAEEAPEALLRAFTELAVHSGREAACEWAAAGAQPEWAEVKEGLSQAPSARVADFLEMRRAASERAQRVTEDWRRGEEAALAVRAGLGKPSGPFSNAMMQQWLSLPPGTLHSDAPASGHGMAFGYRAREDSDEVQIHLRSRYGTGRRFELGRILGDHLLFAHEHDRLLPASNAGTSRQRAQRAFSAELLLPWGDLRQQTHSAADEDAIEATALEYDVSPLLVRTRLVAKGVLAEEVLAVA